MYILGRDSRIASDVTSDELLLPTRDFAMPLPKEIVQGCIDYITYCSTRCLANYILLMKMHNLHGMSSLATVVLIKDKRAEAISTKSVRKT